MKNRFAFHSLVVIILFICFYIGNRAVAAVCEATLAGQSLMNAINGIGDNIVANPWFISTNVKDIAIAASVVLVIVMMADLHSGKKFRPGEEYGSARWGNKNDIAPFIDPVHDNNLLLTATERMTMNSRPKNPDTARNKNVVVIGGSGSGKTRFYIKPNLMQMHSSYVVTDPKGTIMTECGKMLEKGKYVIKALNLNGAHGMQQSLKYNPFEYITCEADILKLVDVLIANTAGDDKHKEDFWVKAERTYYCALIGYIWQEADPEERNISLLLDLINASEARENDETCQSPVDKLFKELAEKAPDCFAVRQYKKFKQAAGVICSK